jgi:DNA polymerase III subunit delta
MPPKPPEPSLSPQQLRANIAAGRVGPLYLIEGTDEVLKSELAGLFADAIEPELRAFNVERLYGTDAALEPRSIADAVKTLPMMAPRRVVVVLQAERVLTPSRESEASDDALKPLIECIEQPVESTTLVFVTHEPLHGARRVTKLLKKHATRVECGGLGPSAQLAREIEERAAEIGVTIDQRAVARLIQLSAGDSGKLRADTERVLVFVGQGTVTAAHVEQVAERVERSSDPWGLTNALEAGDARTALRELRLRLDAGDNIFAMLGQIAWAIRKPNGRMPEHRLRPAVDAMLRTDIALKSSGGNPRMLLERLIVELCGDGVS